MAKGKKYEEKLFLDLPFGEALERYINVDPKELTANLDKLKRKKKKPPSGGGSLGGQGHGVSDQTVVRLRDRRKPKHD